MLLARLKLACQLLILHFCSNCKVAGRVYCQRCGPLLEILNEQNAVHVQDFPAVPKQPEWKAPRMPHTNDWDGLIKEVLDRGKEIPEIPWFKTGEDAAKEVGFDSDQGSRQVSLSTAV